MCIHDASNHDQVTRAAMVPVLMKWLNCACRATAGLDGDGRWHLANSITVSDPSQQLKVGACLRQPVIVRSARKHPTYVHTTLLQPTFSWLCDQQRKNARPSAAVSGCRCSKLCKLLYFIAAFGLWLSAVVQLVRSWRTCAYALDAPTPTHQPMNIQPID